MKTSVGQYLIDRLLAAGADHLFGVPGDFIIGWMSRAEQSRLKLVTTSDEQGAGFAADASAWVWRGGYYHLACKVPFFRTGM